MRYKVAIKFVIICLLIVSCLFCGCAAGCNGCNKTIWDGIQKYDEAIISLPDGTIVRGIVETWNDYEGDQLQVKIDGEFYLVHSTDVVLIAHGK